MRTVRIFLVLAALAAATPAAAQQVFIPSLQLDALRLEQEATQRRMIDQQNQLMAAEAKAKADQAALQLQLQRDLPLRPPEVRHDPTVPAAAVPPATPPAYPTTPDAALADSNRKVQDATRNRR
ncbi:MAG: hypothetical protein AB1942_07065 [Pseudomonadota bacterium]